jgi:hypothetical protein
MFRIPSHGSIRYLPPSGTYVGWRSSRYGHQRDPGYTPQYWMNTAHTFSSQVPGSGGGGVWVIGETNGAGYPKGTLLTFPKPAGTYPNITFTATDENDDYLTAFDSDPYGVKVFLQVEPCNADMIQLINLVLGRYSHHPCVMGFGVDVEWWHCADPPYNNEDSPGRPVTNAEASQWEALVKSYNPNYRLFLKHWISDKMPSSYRGDILFFDDSEQNGSYQGLVDEFTAWGRDFSTGKVAYQIGYPSDRPWWRNLSRPPQTIATRLLNEISNCEGVYWVDFSIDDPLAFPP